MRFADLTDDKIQELSDAIVRKIVVSRLPPLIKMELFLTEACNLRCDYCFVATKKAYRRISWEVARAAIDFLMRESRDENRVEIVLFGGEPLLAFPLMKRVVEYAEQRAQDLGKQISFACTTEAGGAAYSDFGIRGVPRGDEKIPFYLGLRRGTDARRS